MSLRRTGTNHGNISGFTFGRSDETGEVDAMTVKDSEAEINTRINKSQVTARKTCKEEEKNGGLAGVKDTVDCEQILERNKLCHIDSQTQVDFVNPTFGYSVSAATACTVPAEEFSYTMVQLPVNNNIICESWKQGGGVLETEPMNINVHHHCELPAKSFKQTVPESKPNINNNSNNNNIHWGKEVSLQSSFERFCGKSWCMVGHSTIRHKGNNNMFQPKRLQACAPYPQACGGGQH
jgi:hypothetical protein